MIVLCWYYSQTMILICMVLLSRYIYVVRGSFVFFYSYYLFIIISLNDFRTHVLQIFFYNVTIQLIYNIYYKK